MTEEHFEQLRSLAAASTEGTNAFLRRRCVTIAYQLDGHPQQGFGVPVAIGHRFFIVTAGHVIEDNDGPDYWLLSSTSRHFSEGRALPLSQFVNTDLDLGLIEFERPSIPTLALDITPCELTTISLIGADTEGRPTVTVGAPTAHTSLNMDGPNAASMRANAMTYLAAPLPPREWHTLRIPNARDYRPLDATVDIVVPYDQSNAVHLSGDFSPTLPNPKGMSGGGMWDQGFRKDELWNPSLAKLIGIQVSWFPQGQYLRGIQISHAIQMIFDNYPDCRPAIELAFPISWSSRPSRPDE